MLLFGMMLGLLVAAYFSISFFYACAGILTVYVMSWTARLTIFCTIGAWRMQRDTEENWNAKLGKLQEEIAEGSEVMHIVMLPNYKEDENMLCHTLENLGKCPEAKTSMRVVLAMEAREGTEGREKAERLIQRTSHLFASIIPSFHQANIAGEIAGKSSNTQWALREAMRHYASELARFDPSRVFISVGDADTLWHAQYFSSVAYQGLTMSKSRRSWTIWQPPVLLLRNLFTVPGATRVSAYGTFMFELAGLTNQYLGSHMCYSAYSTTLALVSHPAVNGWDSDVIAEDHHMFCKCFFASMWEAFNTSASRAEVARIAPKVQLSPVYLPALSYLVESDDGYFPSMWARFQQARRHSQGVAELSYVVLQYIELVLAAGMFQIPLKTHVQVLALAWNMLNIHIFNNVQATALVGTLLLGAGQLITWACAGGLAVLWESVAAQGVLGALGSEPLDLAKWGLVGVFGPLPPIGILTTFTMYVVIRDMLEERYCQPPLCGESNQSCCLKKNGHGAVIESTQKRLTCREKLSLAMQIQNDMWSLAEVTVVLYGLAPVIMAAWSLMLRGPSFEYIVAAKPR